MFFQGSPQHPEQVALAVAVAKRHILRQYPKARDVFLDPVIEQRHDAYIIGCVYSKNNLEAVWEIAIRVKMGHEVGE